MNLTTFHICDSNCFNLLNLVFKSEVLYDKYVDKTRSPYDFRNVKLTMRQTRSPEILTIDDFLESTHEDFQVKIQGKLLNAEYRLFLWTSFRQIRFLVLPKP